MPDAPLVIHAGYPKTATTTFQQHVFPHHPEIDYLGKFIPSFRYRHPETYGYIEELLSKSSVHPPDLKPLRQSVDAIRAQSGRRVVLISSESFVHPAVCDIGTVAGRMNAAFGPCRIWITVREQISLLLSFYWMHGRFGQYLSLGSLDPEEKLSFPLTFPEWIALQKRAPDRNLLGLLHYDGIISCFGKAIGPENVSVLVFETLRDEPAEYARQVSAVLGIDAETTVKLVAGKREYVSGGRAAPWPAGDGIGTGERMQLTGSEAKSAVKGTEPLTAVIDALRRDYSPGNRRLAGERRLPLDRFHYSM